MNLTNKEILEFWEKEGVYNFKEQGPLNAENIFSIDTPPPTISGNLHIGHICSYTHTDIIARFQRMNGKSVFYPIGYDNNGLPTEKLIEKKFNKRARDYVDKEEFIKNCKKVSDDSIAEFGDLFDSVGFSFDKKLTYDSSDKRASQIAISSFFDLYQKEKIYFKNETVFWDYIDQTAISQAEIEEKKVEEEMFYLKFLVENEEEKDVSKWEYLEVATTRPEFLPNARCVFVHPDDLLLKDGRYNKFNEKWLINPIFQNKIPVLADSRVIKEKGSGAVMCCFFGDELDVMWFNDYKDLSEEIPQKNFVKYSQLFRLKTILNKSGMINFSDLGSDFFKKSIFHDNLMNHFGLPEILKDPSSINMKLKDWRKFMIQLLSINGQNFKEKCPDISWCIEPSNEKEYIVKTEKCSKNVKYAERSGCALEILPTPQWYVKIKNEKEKWLELSEQLNWIPTSMKEKLKAWINGLEYDWCVSRQRFWGIKFPVIFLKFISTENCIKNNELHKGDKLSEDDLILMFDQQENFSNIKKNQEFHHDFFFNEFLNSGSKNISENCYEATCDYKAQYNIYNLRGELICKKDDILISKSTQFSLKKDENVMDTWFTSSVCPQINAYFDLFTNSSEFANSESEIMKNTLSILHSNEAAKSGPLMSMRPQAHEIIRTWAFDTLIKSYYHGEYLPWKNIMISGWCLASNGEKMSKSKGNIMDPRKILTQYSADAIRYWASDINLGSDACYNEMTLKNGRKLVLKIENVYKFLLQFKEQIKNNNIWFSASRLEKNNIKLQLIDEVFFMRANSLVQKVTNYFQEFNYFRALQETENFFWKDFCDNFLEITKVRAYGQYDGVSEEMQKSALFTLCSIFQILLKLFAPFLPFITENINLQANENFLKTSTLKHSIHSQKNWPKSIEVYEGIYSEAQETAKIFEEILHYVRKFKSSKNLSQKEKINIKIDCIDHQFLEKNLEFFLFDLKNVCHIENFELKIFNNFDSLISEIASEENSKINSMEKLKEFIENKKCSTSELDEKFNNEVFYSIDESILIQISCFENWN